MTHSTYFLYYKLPVGKIAGLQNEVWAQKFPPSFIKNVWMGTLSFLLQFIIEDDPNAPKLYFFRITDYM
jgi:hypothetical protein